MGENKMKRALCLFGVLLGSVFLAAQGTAPLYVESFRKGATKISEQTVEANLTMENPSFAAGIKDAEGQQHFLLSVEPVRADQQDTSIIAWKATLIDIHRKVFGNLLVRYRDEAMNEGAKGNAAKFDPNPYALVPLGAPRTIKVENFYCTFRVMQSHRRRPDVWQLDTLTLEAQFSNTKPAETQN